MATAPRRYWYQISLRALLALIACSSLVFAWIAYELEWKRQRQLVLSQYNHANRGPSAPALLWIFGVHGYSTVRLKFEGYKVRTLTLDEEQERERVRRLFPEAQVIAGFEVRDITPTSGRYSPFEPALDE